jgi:hypothetical protein
MANPFFSGRIPQSLYDRVEQYISESGKNKTELLINALSNYLDFPVETKQTNNSNDELWVVVKELQEKLGKENVIAGSRDAAAEYMIPCIHDVAGLHHMGFGHFETASHSYIRFDAPCGARFYHMTTND